MIVSAVVDPSAFNEDRFDDLYTIHVEDFLQGIWKNGLLIVDSDRRLQNALSKKAESLLGNKKRVQILLTELLKEKSKRASVRPVSVSNTSSVDLLELICHLKKDTEADALILGNDNFETVRFDEKRNDGIVQLSKYRDSDFESNRQRYENQFGPIDTLSSSEVENIIICSVRFTKWLRFYDAYIGSGENMNRFQKGIEYILSLWKDHGFFPSEQGIGSVDIFTRNAEQIRDNETDHAQKSKLAQNQKNYQKINRELMAPLKKQFPHWWQINLFVKDDPKSIFHARYLETQHAIIRVDRGFDLFKQNDEFWRNFFTLNMAESTHLKEIRELPEANVGNLT